MLWWKTFVGCVGGVSVITYFMDSRWPNSKYCMKAWLLSMIVIRGSNVGRKWCRRSWETVQMVSLVPSMVYYSVRYIQVQTCATNHNHIAHTKLLTICWGWAGKITNFRPKKLLINSVNIVDFVFWIITMKLKVPNCVFFFFKDYDIQIGPERIYYKHAKPPHAISSPHLYNIVDPEHA